MGSASREESFLIGIFWLFPVATSFSTISGLVSESMEVFTEVNMVSELQMRSLPDGETVNNADEQDLQQTLLGGRARRGEGGGNTIRTSHPLPYLFRRRR